ncbi:MAG: electron transport complex protein RnfC [Firmicutes bacterium]|nr:electron transport complex protein RnfC [Bacillota bacterium]
MAGFHSEIGRSARQAGVVGAGGAAFPTYVKLESQAQVYIANGAECEPLVHVSQEIMARQAASVVRGLLYGMEATGASRGVIALKSKYRAAVAALKAAIDGLAPANGDRRTVDIFLLGDFYPAGDEHVLVYEVTGRRVPQGGIPLSVGVVVNNVETLVNLALAVEHGEPVTGKWVTVAGAVARPITARFAVGTSFGEAIAAAGGATVASFRILDGGPLMGKMVSALRHPITRATSAITVMPEDNEWIRRLSAPLDVSLRRARSHCIQCMACTELCPRYLLGHRLKPHGLMLEASYMLNYPGRFEMAALCSECGVCEAYACPSHLAPRRINARLKVDLAGAGRRPEFSDMRPPDPARAYRLVPTGRLKARLGLDAYDVEPEFSGEAPVPVEVTLLLKQHVGAPCLPQVRVGDQVEKGQVVADVPAGKMGVPVHAPVSGAVERVDEQAVVIRRSSA